MIKFIVRIAPKDRYALTREITVEAYSIREAQQIVEQMYPGFRVLQIR